MLWTNYHGHCQYCDGKGPIASYVRTAIERNMPVLGVSSHAPLPFGLSWTMDEQDLPHYLQEMADVKEHYAGQITLLTGLEIDYIPGISGSNTALIEKAALDYKIISVHFVDFLNSGKPWSIESSVQTFEKGLLELFDNDIQAAVRRFYHLTRQACTTQQFDIIGHFDRIKLQNVSKPFFDEKAPWYVQEIEHTLQTFVENNIIVEINTGRFNRKGNLIFPSIAHFQMMKSLGVSVTINSDAHKPEDITQGFEYVAKELRKAGISHTKEFIEGAWQDVTLSETGLLLNA